MMTKNWTCPGCSKIRRSQFCPQCGEERLRAKDLTLGDVVAQFANRMTSVDGKLLRSSRAILTRPGTLTAAYVRGERLQYLAPLSLFLLANALFVAMQALTRTDILSTPLESHLQVQDWKGFAQSIVARRLETTHQSVSAYAPHFDSAARFNAKALMILMVLAFAPILPLLFRAPRRTAGAHVVFALHLYTFVLVLLCVSIGIAELDLLAGGGGLGSPSVDAFLSLFNVGACAVYLYLAIGPAYGGSGGARYALAALLAVAMAALFVGYRFVIFLITLYGTT
jgi:hypothetical protein